MPFSSRGTPTAAWAEVGAAINGGVDAAEQFIDRGGDLAAKVDARRRPPAADLGSITATSSARSDCFRIRRWWRPNTPAPITATRIWSSHSCLRLVHRRVAGDANAGQIGGVQQFVFIQKQRAARHPRPAWWFRFAAWPRWCAGPPRAHRTADACAARTAFTRRSALPFTSDAARRSIASVPSMASMATQARSRDGHALPHVHGRQRIGDAAAIRARPRLVVGWACAGSARRLPASSGFSRAVESTSVMPSSARTLATPPISASVFFSCSEVSSFNRRQSGRDGGEDAHVLHLPGHHHFGEAFAVSECRSAC